MLNSIDAVNTIREAREEQLIALTTKAVEAALQPLDHGTTDALCDLAREILNVAAQPIPGGGVMDTYPDARRAVLDATGCTLPPFLYDHAVKHIRDPETRRNFMFNAAISYESGDVENITEDAIDAYLEDCAASAA